MDMSSPSVSLREIDDANRRQIELLTVTPEQSTYVASNAQSLEEAEETPNACPRYWGLYAGEVPVGFVMISDNIPAERTEYLGPYFLWRLLIDTRYQRRGYGTAALDLVVQYLNGRPNADTLYSSHVPVDGPASPLDFYLRYGFVLTGDVHDDEPVLALSLTAARS